MKKVIQRIKYVVQVFVLIGFSAANAGSYDDFFVAIKRNDAETVSSLLNRGFDSNTVDKDGNAALYLAVREPSIAVATVLIKWPKTQVESRTAKDESPLMIASLKGLTEICAALIARGADVNKTGWTPLHYAATTGQVKVIALLLENYAYIDAESPNGSTPLMMAAHYGSVESVQDLLSAGADPLLKNEKGLTAIDFAYAAKREDVAKLIAASVRAKAPKGVW
ncbi:ankyrin repeat domain-containing protein [Rhodoferax sp. PAMC 29310]|uniref:ankyrin repeat domain-containing protein n=1 Tax=Rhodoferax sp. PAMC 29310 TaxID=2822760 RepID=UPI001B33B557|nr:ankyrin repeat domain-containing protein [Rhodoferax sp. PAMC 29310]